MRIIYLLLIISALLSPSRSFGGWVLQSSPTSNDLYSVNFNHGNDDIVWACGENGTIIHTSNGGINWVVQNSGTTNNLYAIVFMELTGGPVFAVGENGTILRTTNSGENWISVSSPTGKTLRDISDFNFLIVGDSGVILKSTDIGITWTEIASPTVKNLYAIGATFGAYAVGEGGTVIGAVNSNGLSWSMLTSGVTNDLYGVPLFAGRDIGVGEGGMILRSTNSGVNWYTQNSFTTKNLNSVEYSVNNTSRIYCVGDSGTILRTTDYGVTWGSQVSGTTENLNSTFFYLGDAVGYAVGDNGTILKTTDGGGELTAIEPSVTGQPEKFELFQNYPNPFNPSTSIKFKVESLKNVELKVFDANGREVEILVNQELQPGTYEYNFDGSGLASGIYFYTFTAGEFKATKKMLIIK